MGCFVSKTTVLKYEAQVQKTEEEILVLESSIRNKEKECMMHSFTPNDSLGYYVYQEQLRETYILTILSNLFPVFNAEVPKADNLNTDLAIFAHIRSKQTKLESRLIKKFAAVYEHIILLNQEKSVSIKENVENLLESKKLNQKSSENILTELEKIANGINETSSLEIAIKCFLDKCELDRKIELVQRRYDFKCFTSKETAKMKENREIEGKIGEIRKDIRILQREWNELRILEKTLVGEMRLFEEWVRDSGKTMEKLQGIKEEIEKDLENRWAKEELARLEIEKTQKIQEISELKLILRSLDEEILEIHKKADLNPLESQNKSLKNEIEILLEEIQSLEQSKRKQIEENLQKRRKTLQEKETLMISLKLNIAENREKMEEVEKVTSVQLRKQVIIRLVKSFKNLMDLAFREWKSQHSFKINISQIDIDGSNTLNSSFLSNNPHFKNAIPWEPEKLYDFIDEFMREKNNHDNARLRMKKIPKTINKYLNTYMRLVYRSTNETEKAISMMVKSLLIEDKKNGIAAIFKKILMITNDYVPYHIAYLITQLWHQFDLVKLIEEENSAGLLELFTIIEEYTEDKSMGIGEKILEKITQEGISKEQLFLLILKYKFNDFKYKFPVSCSEFAIFAEFVKEKIDFFMPSNESQTFLEQFYAKFPKVFLPKIANAVKNTDKDICKVSKSLFLNSFIDVFNDYKSVHLLALDEILKPVQTINKEIFVSLVLNLDPSLEKKLISKLFDEISNEENKFATISHQFFKQIILKYGISGYGIGPFKCKAIADILLQYLTKEKQKNLRRQPSDLIPYKANNDSMEDSLNISSENNLYHSILEILPTKISRISHRKKSRSPSPAPVVKSVIASKFFSAKRSNTPRLSSEISKINE